MTSGLGGDRSENARRNGEERHCSHHCEEPVGRRCQEHSMEDEHVGRGNSARDQEVAQGEEAEGKECFP